MSGGTDHSDLQSWSGNSLRSYGTKNGIPVLGRYRDTATRTRNRKVTPRVFDRSLSGLIHRISVHPKASLTH